MSRSLAFASSINRSKWFTKQINEHAFMKRVITNRLRDHGHGERKEAEARHLDGKDNALKRNDERRWLNGAPKEKEARIISNCKVFGEGVDVPALDAVVFLDPKQSHVEIVQAVGRVMRKVWGKQRGYIVVPVVLGEGEDDAAELLAQRPGRLAACRQRVERAAIARREIGGERRAVRGDQGIPSSSP